MALALTTADDTARGNPAAPASQQGTTGPSAASTTAWGPYCGLYSLYAAMRLQSAEPDFASLVKPEYCGSEGGSSLAELKRAAEASGFRGVALQNLTGAFLRGQSSPAILHVKKDENSAGYDHYILFVRAAGDQARIFDPPHGFSNVSFRELNRRWDGTGLFVTADPAGTADVERASRLPAGWVAGAAALGLLAVAGTVVRRRGGSAASPMPAAPAGPPRRPPLRAGVAQFGALSAAALGGAMLFHLFAEQGLLAADRGALAVQKAKHAKFLPRVTRDQMREMVRRPDVVVVDARRAADFAAGHLDGAISVPVDTSASERRDRMSHVPPTATVVVYCQSEGCPYADVVAQGLTEDGYENLALYRGGWVEWSGQ